ncbi:MAG: hypothetical protein IKM74_03815 [Bacteroidales bacterium]|nr:hypothetical protein [Bacteroidales bacterium]
MDQYLVLFVDVEFIAGAICTGYDAPRPIQVDGESLIWLYFFNDPFQQRVSFGKGYKRRYMNGESNYYGHFFTLIENDENTFSLRHSDFHYPAIELLKASGMLDLWRSQYEQVTQTSTETIPSLLTFSPSISDLSKQRFVDFVKKNNFDVKSYTIPLAELAYFKLLQDGKINLTNCRSTMMLEATNSTLHFSKLTYSDNYFLKDGDVESLIGRGIDPRKRAICKYLVGELNSQLGLLFSDEEKESEIERFEQDAAEWLKRLELSIDRPIRISGLSFRVAINNKRDILVRKNDVDNDTGSYLRYLSDQYQSFKENRFPNGVDFCCFVGNCFISDRIKQRFDALVGDNKTVFFKTTDIVDIIKYYPRINLQRYADEESRIRERARADELKQAAEREAQRAREAAAKAEQERLEQLEREKRNKEEAEKAYQLASDCDRRNMLEDAKANIDKAVLLDPTNLDYRRFADFIDDKIQKKQGIVELYKKYLSLGDTFYQNGSYEEALSEYEKALAVDDNPKIKDKILDCKDKIKKLEKKRKQIAGIMKEVKSSLALKDYDLAEKKVQEVLAIDPNHQEAQTMLATISDEKWKKSLQVLIDKVDKVIKSGKLDDAEVLVDQLLELDPENKKGRAFKFQIEEAKSLEKEKQKAEELKRKVNEAVTEGDRSMKKGNLVAAHAAFETAKKLDPKNANVKAKLLECEKAIKANALKQKVESLIEEFNSFMQQKDLDKAYQRCVELEAADSEHVAKWSKQKDRLKFMANLSNPRTVRAELASIKALERVGKVDEAKQKALELKEDLNMLGIHDYDKELDAFGGFSISPKPGPKPDPKPGPKPGLKTDPKPAPKPKPDTGYGQSTQLSDREIIKRKRDVKALISQHKFDEAKSSLEALKKQMTNNDFEKYFKEEMQKIEK